MNQSQKEDGGHSWAKSPKRDTRMHVSQLNRLHVSKMYHFQKPKMVRLPNEGMRPNWW